MALRGVTAAIVLAGCATATSPHSPVSPAPTTPPPRVSHSEARPPPTPRERPRAPGSFDDDAPIGTAHPFTFVRADPSARWVVFCQARRDSDHDGRISSGVNLHGGTFGDVLDPYLVLPDGEMALDEFVSATPSGNQLAYVRAGRLVVRDLSRGSETDLSAHGADASSDPDDPLGEHPAASFDDAGRYVLYRVRAGRDRVAVLRELATGTETRFDPRPAHLVRASIDPLGIWVGLQVVARDTNGNGRVDRPRIRTSLSGRRCRGPVTIYSTGSASGDEPEWRFAPIAGGEPLAMVPVAALGEAMIVRGPDGALDLIYPDRRRRTLTPAACAGIVLYRDHTRGLAMVVCSARVHEGLAPVELHGAEVHRSLGFGIEGVGEDQTWFSGDERFVAVGTIWSSAPERGAVVDMREQRARRMPAVWARGTHALVRRGDGLLVVDLSDGSETTLPVGSVHRTEVGPEGDFVWYSDVLVDLATGLLIGRTEGGTPNAVSNDGRVLVPGPGVELYGGVLPSGPLRWVRPR